MPQLDSMHFFTQFFWLCIGSIFLYLYLFHFILPQLYTILIFRKKKLFLLSHNINYNKEFVHIIQQNYDILLSKCFTISNDLLINTDNSCLRWYTNSLAGTFFNHFRKTNLVYLQTIAEVQYIYFFTNKLVSSSNKISLLQNITLKGNKKISVFLKKVGKKKSTTQLFHESSKSTSETKNVKKKSTKNNTNKTKHK